MFGRRSKEDEDPFVALKQDATYESTPLRSLPGIPGSGEEREAPRPAATPSATGRPRRPTARVRRSGYGRHVLLFRVLAPLVAVGVAAVVFKTGSTGTSPSIKAINTAPALGPNAGTFSGHNGSRVVSYLTAANLAAGLAHVQRLAPGAKLLLLRIDATSLDATTIGPHGVVKEISFSTTGTLVAAGASTGTSALPFSAVRPAVVTKLVGEMKRRFHVPVSRINYIVLISPGQIGPIWGVYLENGADYQASLTGSGLHRSA